MSKRINVMVSDTLNEKLDKYSEKYGVTKSSIVGFVLGQWVDSMENVNKSVFGSTGHDGIIGEVLKGLMQSSNVDVE